MNNIKELLSTILPVESWLSFMPEAASTQAAHTDAIFYFLFWTCSGLFLLVVIPMVFFTIRYRRKTPDQKAIWQKDHNQFLEITWSALPLIYLAVLFAWGFYGFLNLYMPPGDAKELRVVGQKWQWTVQYPDDLSVSGQGAVIGVKIGQPVKLVMSSQDVIHSFFIPNFRVKQDVIPGRYTTLWFEPTKEGEFPVFCAEYCGDQHSQMMAKIKVMNEVDYAAWSDKAKSANVGLSPRDLGEKLFAQKGCNACHTTDGNIKIGPSFKALFGKNEELQSGKTITVDDDYIRHKVLEPQANVAKGFPPVMPTFKGQLSELEINGLIAYIKSLK